MASLEKENSTETASIAATSASTSVNTNGITGLASTHHSSSGSLHNLEQAQKQSELRRSHIITCEVDDDDDGNNSLDGHLQATAAEIMVTPEQQSQSQENTTLKSPLMTINGGATYDKQQQQDGMNIMNGATTAAATTNDNAPPVEMSLMSEMSPASNVKSETVVGNGVVFHQPKKLSPLSSRISSSMSADGGSGSPTSQHQNAKYIPPSLSISNGTNDTLVSITPTSDITTATTLNNNNAKIGSNQVGNSSSHSKKSGDSTFDFDATAHGRKKGTGYLASQLSLSTPTDVFASGCTLLQLCAIGNLPSVKEYVSKTFNNVNFRDYDRRTALHVASSEGHLDVVKYLVSKGAHINKSDRWGGSPLDDAHRHRHTDVARYLRSKGAKTGSLNLTSNLIAAAAAGDIEEVTLICADVGTVSKLALDLSDSKSRAAVAAAVSKVSVLDLSSSKGKSNNARNFQNSLDLSEGRNRQGGGGSDGGTGLESSPRSAVDINKGDYDKRTALHLAASEGHLDVVQYLIKRGANVNTEDRWGGRPLDDALQKGHERVVEVLRKHGAKTAEGAQPHRASASEESYLGKAGASGGQYGMSSHHFRQNLLPAPEEDENLRVDFAELEMIERIGSGAFGEIYKCRWRGILVAAKCIKASKIQKEWILKNRGDPKERIANRVEAIKQTAITDEEKELALEDFRRETAIMRRLRHPNIVMMLAYSHTEDVEVMISEICRCSLLDIFKANNISNSQIPKRTQIVYAQQLAQGMNHLHKSRPPIIHRDLKPANLLIDFSGTLKITDFGLAKIRPNPEQNESEAFLMTGETGSYRFMAPEVFRHEDYTESVDVYSYAMIFYYMLRSTPPWAGLSGLDAVTKAAVDGERPIIPRNVDERLSTLLKRSWDEDNKARPSFDEIITCLNIYSHDVFKTSDNEVQMASHDKKCAGCVIS